MSYTWSDYEYDGRTGFMLEDETGYPHCLVWPVEGGFTDNFERAVWPTKQAVAIDVSENLIRYYRKETPYARCYIRREIDIIRAIRAGEVPEATCPT
jgi:hypothetical protein